MGKIDGARIIVKTLKEYGVEIVFCLTGGHTFRILQECDKAGIRVVDTRHETAAVDAAGAYSRTTGKLGVVILTAGPGVTSGLNGTANAKLSGFPLLVIGGAQSVKSRQTKEMQELDQLTLMKSVTNWADSCVSIGRLAEYVTIAIREAVQPPRGPAFLEVPVNLLTNDEIEGNEVKYPNIDKSIVNPQIAASDKIIDEATDLLLSTENVVMILGDQIVYNLTKPEVFGELAHYLKIPISTTIGDSARFLPPDDGCILGGLAAPGMAEIIISFNSVIDYVANKFEAPNINPAAKIIQVSDDPRQLGFNHEAEIAIVGTPDVVAGQLLKAIKEKTPPRDESDWLEMLPEMRESIYGMLEESADVNDSNPIHPARAAKELVDFLKTEGSEYNLVVDGGDCQAWLGSFCALSDGFMTRPNRVMIGTYKLGSIGCGAGITSGTYFGTNKPVIYSTGDGSLGQYLGEFFTYAKHEIPVICFIFNDSCWNMIKTFAEVKYPESDTALGCTLKSCDCDTFRYEKLAEAFDGYHEYVDNPAEIRPALQRALKSGKVSIISVRTASIPPDSSTGMAENMYAE